MAEGSEANLLMDARDGPGLTVFETSCLASRDLGFRVPRGVEDRLLRSASVGSANGYTNDME